MTTGPEREAKLRAEFRAFVKRHHPDVGGDPGEFAAGLARFRERERQPPPAPGRFDAPVVFTHRPAGLAGAAVPVARWWRWRRRPPRVR